MVFKDDDEEVCDYCGDYIYPGATYYIYNRMTFCCAECLGKFLADEYDDNIYSTDDGEYILICDGNKETYGSEEELWGRLIEIEDGEISEGYIMTADDKESVWGDREYDRMRDMEFEQRQQEGDDV